MEAAPKTVSEHKINFGWPNFFNPEMGMMREKGGKKDAGGKGEQEGNEVNTSQEEDEYESLIDYTLKVGQFCMVHCPLFLRIYLYSTHCLPFLPVLSCPQPSY